MQTHLCLDKKDCFGSINWINDSNNHVRYSIIYSKEKDYDEHYPTDDRKDLGQTMGYTEYI